VIDLPSGQAQNMKLREAPPGKEAGSSLVMCMIASGSVGDICTFRLNPPFHTIAQPSSPDRGVGVAVFDGIWEAQARYGAPQIERRGRVGLGLFQGGCAGEFGEEDNEWMIDVVLIE